MDIDAKKFEKLALARLPVLLVEKMDRSDPTNVKMLREITTLLLLEYAQMESVRLPQYKAEKQAKMLVDIFDFYYENFVIRGDERLSQEEIDYYNKFVAYLSSKEANPTYQQLYRKHGKGVASPTACRKAFEFLQNNNITKNKWMYEAWSIDGKNLTEFARLPMAKRRKMEFKDLNKVKPGSFDHLLIKNDDMDFFFGQIFTKCMEEYHKSINLTFKGIQATSFPNINDRFNLSRFDTDSDPESSSVSEYMIDSQEEGNEEKNNEAKEAEDDENEEDDLEYLFPGLNDHSADDPEFFDSDWESNISNCQLAVDNLENTLQGSSFVAEETGITNAHENTCNYPTIEEYAEIANSEEEFTRVESNNEISSDQLPHVPVDIFSDFLKAGICNLFHSPTSFMIYSIAIRGWLSYDRTNQLLKKGSTYGFIDKRDLEVRRLHDRVSQVWQKLSTGVDVPYCPCHSHTYYFETAETACQNPKCNLSRDSALSFRYEGLQSMMIAMHGNDFIRNKMLVNKSKALSNSSVLSSISNGRLYRESVLAENSQENTFIFNIGLSSDDCNLFIKTYKGVKVFLITFFDLPESLRYNKTFNHIPLALTTKREANGSTGAMAKILMKEIDYLTNVGIKMLSNNVEITLKTNLISITGDIVALNKVTETLNSVSHNPCLYCKIPRTKNKILLNAPYTKEVNHSDNASTEAENSNTIAEVNRYLEKIRIETEFYRLLVSSGQFIDSSGWKIKAIPLVAHHSTLDIFRVLCPDFMHTGYENVFAKRICGVFCDRKMKDLDLILHKKVLERKTETNDYIAKSHLFEEVKEINKFLTPSMATTRIKAVDMKSLSHLFSFYFVPLMPYLLMENNSNTYIEIVKYLLEFNCYVIAFASRTVPLQVLRTSNGLNPLKNSFIALILKLEEELSQPERAWLDIVFSLPTHQVLHMFDKWEDFGSFKDNWCFGMERACNKVRNLVKAGANAYKSLNGRLSIQVLENCMAINEFEDNDLSCYKWGRSRKINPIGELERKVTEFYTKIGTSSGELITRDLSFLRSRSTRIDTLGTYRYAKIFADQSWTYLKVLRLVVFEDNEKKGLLMKYNTVKINTTWVPTVQGIFDFGFYTRIISEDETEKWIWLDDSVEIYGFCVLEEFENVVVDQNPDFGIIFRKHDQI